jgi:hypothetical protein
MVHHTKDKGDLAAVKAIADLTSKGFVVFVPAVCEHLPFDIAAYRDGKFLRFQSKYRESGEVSGKTSWTDKNGTHNKKYIKEDFDYYALYLPDKDVVCYPSVGFAGSTISTSIPNSPTPFYWYEDFIDLTDSASKRTYRDFGFEITRPKTQKPQFRKVERPTKEELKKLVWELPLKELGVRFGVSDKAVSKWAKQYDIQTPGRGYWNNKHPV